MREENYYETIFAPRGTQRSSHPDGLIEGFVESFTNSEVGIKYNINIKWDLLYSNTQSSDIKKELKEMDVGRTLVMFIRAQNSGLFMTKLENENLLVSAFEASLPMRTVMNASSSIRVECPGAAVEVNHAHLTSSSFLKEFSKHIEALSNNKLDDTSSKFFKAGEQNSDAKDVVDPKYVTTWLLSTISGNSGMSAEAIRVTKTIKDFVESNKRRDPTWFVIKVPLQICFIRRYGERMGYVMYKLAIIEFLVCSCVKYVKVKRSISDIPLQMIKRIANKIKKLSSIPLEEGSEFSKFVEQVIKKCVNVIGKVHAFIDNKWKAIQNDYRERRTIRFKAPDSGALDCNLKFVALRNFISTLSESTFEFSFKPFVLNNKSKHDNFLFAYESELLSSPSNRRSNELLGDVVNFRSFETYFKGATEQYSNIPEAWSNSILTMFYAVVLKDSICVDTYPILKEHKTGLDISILCDLILPFKHQMKILEDICSYVTKRDEEATFPSLMDSLTIDNENSFASRFYKQDSRMLQYKDHINKISLQLRKENEKDVMRAKAVYNQLIRKSQETQCNRMLHVMRRRCDSCSYKSEAECMSGSVHEWPLPEEDNEINSIIFELRMPKDLAELRDMIYLTMFEACNKGATNTVRVSLLLQEYEPLKHYYEGHQKYAVMASGRWPQKKSLPLNEHISQFSRPCGMNYYLADRNNNNFIVNQEPSVSGRCIMSISDPNFRSLQWMVGNFHTNNEVIAKQNTCPREMAASEFIAFGDVRANERMQWDNILIALESRSISLSSQASYALFCQAIWQAGSKSSNWRRQPHEQIGGPKNGVMLTILNEITERFETNWKECDVMLIVVTMACRLLCLSGTEQDQKSAVELIKKCRGYILKWIHLITNMLQEIPSDQIKVITDRRNDLCRIAACGVITYHVGSDYLPLVADSQDLVKFLFIFSILIQNKHNMDNSFLHRVGQSSLVMQKYMHNYIKSHPRILDDYVQEMWVPSKKGRFQSWKRDGVWYNTTFQSDSSSDLLINTLNGDFLVDGNRLERLSDRITSHVDYKRTFNSRIVFEVLPGLKPNTQITKHYYHHCKLSFKLTLNNKLFVSEEYDDGRVIHLVSHTLLKDELPHHMVHNYSHWYDEQKGIVEFRPLNTSILQKPQPVFTLDIKENNSIHLYDNRIPDWYLVDINSPSFGSVVKNLLDRLELRQHIHIYYDNKNKCVQINLPRMGLRFTVDHGHDVIRSREFDGMVISPNQSLGTLIGLINGLVLVDSVGNKRLIVPHGQIERSMHPYGHQETTISVPLEAENICYYVYEVDNVLQQLKADSSNSWLMLANLYASTSSFSPDEFNGLCGYELALQLLQSPLCHSSQPLNKTTYELLNQIIKCSPHIEETKSRQSISIVWPTHLPSMAALDAYKPLVNWIINDSNKLNKLFPDREPTKLLEYSEKAHIKAYWGSYDLYGADGHLQSIHESTIIGRRPQPTKNTARDLFLTQHTDVANISEIMLRGGRFTFNRNSLAHIYNWLLEDPECKYLMVNEDLKDDILSWTELDPKRDFLSLYRLTVDFKNQYMLCFCLSLLSFRNNSSKLYLTSLAIMAIYSNKTLYISSDLAYHPQEGYQYDRSKLAKIIQNSAKTKPYNYHLSSKSIFETESQFAYRCQTDYQSSVNTLSSNLLEHLAAMDVNEYNDTISLNHSYEYYFNCFLQASVSNQLRLWYNNIHLINFLTNYHNELESLEPAYEREQEDYKAYWLYEQLRDVQEQLPDEHMIDLCLTQHKGSRLFFDAKSLYERHSQEEKTTNNLKKSVMDGSEINDLFVDSECEVVNHYQNNLNESWSAYIQKLEKPDWFNTEITIDLEKETKKKSDHVEKEIQSMIENIQQSWFRSLNSNSTMMALQKADLWPKFTIKNILRLIVSPDHSQSSDVITYIGAMGVLLTKKQRYNRILQHIAQNDRNAIKKELFYQGHTNWLPKEYPEWLLLEIENNFLVRPTQATVALEMLKSESNMTLQLNMGEGKTSVIVPLLASTIADGKTLARIVVLKPLLKVNFESLQQKLGGILQRRIYLVPFQRDFEFDQSDLNQMQATFEECCTRRGVIMTLQEYMLSFQLMVLDRAELPYSHTLLSIQKYLDHTTRDILDESDEILHYKYQLVYTVGGQNVIHGDELRWIVIQQVLQIIKNKANEFATKFPNEVDYIESKHGFDYPQIRIVDQEPGKAYQWLCEMIMNEIIKGDSSTHNIKLPEVHSSSHSTVINFVVKEDVYQQTFGQVEEMMGGRDTYGYLTLLIIRGLLGCKILFHCMSKRWRVNYGVNPKANRRMAVPFRAKDLASDRTEFGHADVAILFTLLSYYYSGISYQQIEECFKILDGSYNRDQEYIRWMSSSNKTVPSSISSFDSINPLDHDQRNLVIEYMSKNTAVINYWLSHAVFRKESKQFEKKIVTSGWDLAKTKETPSRSTIGFSGTNDTQLLLPTSIQQRDLKELKSTNAMVIHYLLGHNGYESLQTNTSALTLLQTISESSIRILLDVGALMLELNNQSVATNWLFISPPEIQAAVYFDEQDQLVVQSRSGLIENPLSSHLMRQQQLLWAKELPRINLYRRV
ncbi:keratin type II [Acrasis kona]|uniref:ubiquitinyl hydrolase 1 n=1 Tax=Acrasis kona TaxID=1008807 RepID=A0AAW2YLJ2_9EUKA